MLARSWPRRLLQVILTSLLWLGVFGAEAVRSRTADTANTAAAGTPMIIPHVLNVNCVSVPSFTSTYVKIADIGTFPVQSPGSIIEATWHGRVNVDSLTSANGVVFELRIDNAPTTLGRARAMIRSTEISAGQSSTVAVTGIFRDLSAGNHTVSIWARAGNTGGSGTGARVDPGCWSADHIVIKEYTPFGFVMLPTVLNE